MNLVVFGTSLLWGQGLEDADKIHRVLARMLQDHHTQDRVDVTFLAHSGASTGFNPDGSVDTRRESRIDGEVPTPYPTIVQQMEEFDALNIDPETVDVVLIDAGINDVHVSKILNPLVVTHEIANLTEIYCHQHMILLIERVLEKFTKARIVIVGYYEFVTEASEEDYLHSMIKGFGKIPGGVVTDLALEMTKGLVKKRLLANCDTFAEQSLAAFRHTADDLNQHLPVPRVFVASPDIQPEHAAFASDPWLFGVNDDLSPQDPCAESRCSACHAAGKARTHVLFCELASAGHPNPKGTKAYAEAIFALL